MRHEAVLTLPTDLRSRSLTREGDGGGGHPPSPAGRRTKMGPGIGQTPQRTRCLRLNALALAFSLAHTVADYGVIFATADFNTWGVAAYLGVSSAVYGWWGWSMARAAAGSRAALPS